MKEYLGLLTNIDHRIDIIIEQMSQEKLTVAAYNLGIVANIISNEIERVENSLDYKGVINGDYDHAAN